MAFVELSDPVRLAIAGSTPRERLVGLLVSLDPEDLAAVSESVPGGVLNEVSSRLASAERSVFDDKVQFPEESVGHYMTREWVAIAETSTVERCLTDLRTRGDLPPQTDRIFVVDARNVLRGTVPLQSLIVRPPSTALSDLLTEDTVKFQALDDVADAARAFERYDLVSAPVVDDRGKLIGRLAVDSVIDFVRYKSGLREAATRGSQP